MTNINFILDGKPVNGLAEWMDTEICINIFGDNISTNIDNFTFVGDAAKILLDIRDKGCSGGVGITEGVTFDIVVSCDGVSNVINMFVDLFSEEACFIEDECKVIAPLELCENKETLSQCLEANSFDYLRSINETAYDNDCVEIPFIAEKIDVGFELAFLTFATFIAIYQTVQAGVTVIKDIINLTVVQSFADIIRGVLKLIADLIVFAALLINTINFINELIDYIFPPIRYHKGMSFLNMLKKAYAHCGYQFKYEGMDELDCLYYLPSKPTKTDIVNRLRGQISNTCLPLPSEQAYTLKGFVDIVKKIFKAETYIKDGCVNMYPLKDEERFLFSDYKMPKVQNKVVKYNTNEFKATQLLQFATDISDGHTITEYKGVAFQKRAKQINSLNQKKGRLNGLNECNIPLALGARKEELSQIEEALENLLNVFDQLIGAFGGSTSYANIVTQRLGMLKVENQIHNVPKALFLNPDGTIKQNHKDTFSAKPIFKKYHETYKQQGVVKNLIVPFCCSDFNKVNCFKNFNDCDSKKSTFKSIKWNISKKTAVISYNYELKYTNNIDYVEIEPE